MNRFRTLALMAFAAAVGAVAGNTSHPAGAQASSLGVLMLCNSAQGNFNATGTLTSVTQTCTQAYNDTSGLSGVTLTFSAPTQRYAVGVTGTVTLP